MPNRDEVHPALLITDNWYHLSQDGYVTAYVGNESNADVFFDDVQVEHRQGLQVQETQYDPTGLELAGITRQTPGLKPLNQYRWNGKEFQPDLGLNWTQLDWRMVDPQLGGRFHVVDPEVENGQETMSPYAFGFDNALRFNDPNGRNPGGGGGVWEAVTAAAGFANGFLNGMAANSTSLPNGMSLVGRVEPHSQAEAAGQTAADLVSLVQGGAEFLQGGSMAATGAVGGVVTAETGVGAAAGYGLAVAGATEAAHGVNTMNNAARNLLGDHNGRYNASSDKKAGTYSHPDSQNSLPREPTNKGGKPEPDPAAAGRPHTRLGREQSRNARVGSYNQAREFGGDGKAVKDVDFTDHGRPANHANPHQHSYVPNPSGGTPRRDDAELFHVK